MKRIGIFGGTFNPIHNGHIQAASEVLHLFSMDTILFIPSYIPPHKESGDIASPSERLEMVRRAVGPYPNFEASSIEIDAAKKSYSITTLEKIKGLYRGREIYFILGIDAFLDIASWKKHDEVLNQCAFVVISRPGYNLDEASAVLDGKYTDRMETISAGAIPAGKGGTPHIYLLAIKAMDISSTEIRKKARNGLPIKDLVPGEVADYIRKNNIYQGE